jgi:hypothetical protein
MSGRAPFLLVIVILITLLTSLAAPAAAQDDDPPDAGPAPGAVGKPAAPLADKRVYDMANLLSNGQEASIETDAQRLARHGIPNVTVVRLGTMTPQEADDFATEIRLQWGVESSPNAEDGLVILVSVTDTEEGQAIATTVSWGDKALPHFGVTEATSTDIQRSWLDRYIGEGYLYEGILFTLRRLIYHSIYDPAPQEPLTGARASLGAVMSVAGIAIAAGALALAGWRWIPGLRRRDGGGVPEMVLVGGLSALAVAVFALSVAGHSGWGVTAALVLLGVAAADWVARDPRRAPETRGAP